MLQEFITYFANLPSCPHYVRELSLLQELIAIESRYRRLKQFWDSHLQNCKNFILEQINESQIRNGKVLIIGAGLLNDVPLAELARLFKEVILLDVFFLRSTKNKLRQYLNVKIYEMDITGTFVRVLNLLSERIFLHSVSRKKFNDEKGFLSQMEELINKRRPYALLKDETVSHVISLNLLSQLPLAILNYIEKEEKILRNDPNINLDNSTQIIESYYQSLIINHLQYLQKFKTRKENSQTEVILITDTEKIITDKSGKVLKIENSLQGLDLMQYLSQTRFGREWTWDLAPVGELDKNLAMQLKVLALKL